MVATTRYSALSRLALLYTFLLTVDSQYAKYSSPARVVTIGNTPVSHLPDTTANWNPSLEVDLIDIEPEANLPLDPIPVATNASTNLLLSKVVIAGESNQPSRQVSGITHSAPDNDIKVDLRHFVLVHPASWVTVRATLGPFSARHTIDPFVSTTTANRSSQGKSEATSRGPSDQIVAYLVTKEVRRSQPVLRVLFYASHSFEFQVHSDDDNTLCAAVIVQYHGERLFGTCSPSKHRQSACLAEVTIPAFYWPPLDVTNGGGYAAKQQKSSSAKVYYTIAHTGHGQQCNNQAFLSLLSTTPTDGGDGTVSDLSKAEHAMSLIYLSDVALVPFRGSYEEVTNDNVVTVLIPQEPVSPNSKIYIPVKYTYNPDYPVSAFSLRVQVKPGLKILGAQLSHPNKLWQLSIELGSKQTTATVTAYLRDFDQDNQSLPDELLENMSQEVYSWLIEVEPDVDISEMSGRIVWQLLYTDNYDFGRPLDMQQQQNMQQQENSDFDKESSKLTSLIDIQKDVVQEVLAVTKSRELLNTAILNGRQVSRTMRIYQVSAAGSISDITFQCSCQSADESILKVSPSCTSVYLDGSEVRGSQNATIVIRYGSFTGQGNFVVWMPLIPLDVRVSDNKLSQIKGWRVPHRNKRTSAFANSVLLPAEKQFDLLEEEMLLDESARVNEKFWANPSSHLSSSCRLKYQQAHVEVYTRFLSSDHNSGREASLLNRRHSLRITHLVRNLIRVTDPKVLRVYGNIVEGVGLGRADVEIISPLTGSVIGSKEVRVSMDRESITKMEIRPVSGISLHVEPFESNYKNIWTVKTYLHHKLSKQYQEALLDVRLHFSDQTSIALSEIHPSEYKLVVTTIKGVVDKVTRDNIAFRSIGPSNGMFIHEMPRIIALVPGSGELVQVNLDIAHACQKKKSQFLASASVDIDVDFRLPDSTSTLQNDANNYRRFHQTYFLNNQSNKLSTSYTKNSLLNRIINPLDQLQKKRTGLKETYLVGMKNVDSESPRNQDAFITFQRHSNVSPSYDSTVKLGFYSLLTIVSVASIILVILYSVFSFRVRHRSPYVTSTIRTEGVLALHNITPFNFSTNNGQMSKAKDWVWIGKDELENVSRYKHREERNANLLTRPLLPPRDYNLNKVEHLSHIIQSSNKKSNQVCSYDKHLRITNNPAERLLGERNELEVCDKEELSGSEKSLDLNGVLIPPTHKPTRIWNASSVSFTAQGDSPPQVPSRTRHIPIPKRGRAEERCPRSGPVFEIANHSTRGAPSVPLHQSSGGKLSVTARSVAQSELPPPVPPHRTPISALPKSHVPSRSPARPSNLDLKHKNTHFSGESFEEKLNLRNMLSTINRLKESDA